jgi:hypothetical protein
MISGMNGGKCLTVDMLLGAEDGTKLLRHMNII